MELPEASEPIDLKEKAKNFHKEHPNMDSDSLHIWTEIGGTLASYLWTECEWGKILRKNGIKWGKFEKIVSKGIPNCGLGNRWIGMPLLR